MKAEKRMSFAFDISTDIEFERYQDGTVSAEIMKDEMGNGFATTSLYVEMTKEQVAELVEFLCMPTLERKREEQND